MVGKVERYEVWTETADNNTMIVYSRGLAVDDFREINGSKCQAGRAGGSGGRSPSGFLAASHSSEEAHLAGRARLLGYRESSAQE